MDDLNNKTAALVAEINVDELAVRFLEIMVGAPRPDEVTAAEIIEDMEAAAAANPQLRLPLDHSRKMAVAAIEYVGEAVRDAQRAN